MIQNYGVKYIFRSFDKTNERRSIKSVELVKSQYKLCLNVQKTEQIIPHPNSLNIDPSVKFKLKGKQLIYTSTICRIPKSAFR